MDLVVVVDCEEDKLRKRLLRRSPSALDSDTLTVDKKIAVFKTETLHVIKHFDDKGKVVVVSSTRINSLLSYNRI